MISLLVKNNCDNSFVLFIDKFYSDMINYHSPVLMSCAVQTLAWIDILISNILRMVRDKLFDSVLCSAY